jgi:acetylornithine deacetylase
MMQAKIIELLSALIAFPSVSRDSNHDIAAYIEAYLEAQGVAVTRIPAPDEPKVSLLASIGPLDRPGVMLSAHMDVVPTDRQDWIGDPFRAVLRDGRLHGRGATDMKGFLAVALAHVPQFRAAATTAPVHLAFSYDEELGCRGAPDLASAASRLPCPPALCIVGEPTQMKVARAHKGKIARRLTFHGRNGHSALPDRAANAVEAAARVAAAISSLDDRLAANGLGDAAFDPPRSTLHVGSLHGGGALNLVPDRAVLEFELRYLPGEAISRLMADIDEAVALQDARLRARGAEGIASEEMIAYPGLDMAAGSAAIAAVGALAGDPAPGSTVSFGTEAGIFQRHGIPSLVCGPGDIARAHKADEWIALDELASASTMMDRLAARLDAPLKEWMPDDHDETLSQAHL